MPVEMRSPARWQAAGLRNASCVGADTFSHNTSPRAAQVEFFDVDAAWSIERQGWVVASAEGPR